MAVLLAVHSFQFFINILVIYFIKGFDNAIGTCVCCAQVVPFIVYIYIAVAVGVLHGCQDLMRTWLITDCIVFGF